MNTPPGRPCATPPTPMASPPLRSIRARRRAGVTEIKVTYYDVVGVGGELAEFETFTLRRRRRD